MKFVLVKSNLGFADRFQLVCFIIQYSKKTGRIIVVDWTDNIWCGQETSKDFYHYFSFQNFENVTSPKQFKLWYIDYIKGGNKLSIFPKNFNILARSYGNADIPESGKNNKFLEICDNQVEDYSEDVVVVYGIDNRSNSCLVHVRHIGFNIDVMSFIEKVLLTAIILGL